MAFQPQAAVTSSSSRTIVTQHQPRASNTIRPATLVLRAEQSEERHIQWAEDVVDNENMGKKSSKVCCIYHKPHAVGESSSDDSSSSDSSSDNESDHDGRARPVGGDQNKRNGRCGRKHGRNHNHEEDDKHVEKHNDKHDDEHDDRQDGEHDDEHADGEACGDGSGKGKAKEREKKAQRKRSPNAYEKMPKYRKKGEEVMR